MIATGLERVPSRAGVDESSMLATEHRLGRSLPQMLRDFYRTVGQLPEVMGSHHKFVPVESLEISNGGLVFCRDRQDEMFWALLEADLGEADPPIVQGQPELAEWHAHCKSSSVFLANFCCWQLVNAMPSMGSSPLGDGTIRALRKHMRVVGASFGFDMLSLVGADAGVLASILLSIDRLYVGARSDAGLEHFQERCGIDLDWL